MNAHLLWRLDYIKVYIAPPIKPTVENNANIVLAGSETIMFSSVSPSAEKFE